MDRFDTGGNEELPCVKMEAQGSGSEQVNVLSLGHLELDFLIFSIFKYLKTRKGFTIVAFTNRTVFVLDLFILLSLFDPMFWP